eukprot:gene10741-12710_t
MPIYEQSEERWPEEDDTSSAADDDKSATVKRPNVLIWLLDDCGYAQTAPYGSPIATPTISKLASSGLAYSNFHSTALCSPSRASLLSGRNHHSIGMGSHALTAMGFPGYSARVPRTAAGVAKLLQRNGYATFALGKWDHTPFEDISVAGPFEHWPSGAGFDHFYGFMAADAHNFKPVFFQDHSPVQPSLNRSDYHLSADIADKAIEYITATKSVKRDKPFFMYWATGAVHAPHHAPTEYLEKYKGQFDAGWDMERSAVHQKQLNLGVIPEGTVNTERPSSLPAWDSLSDEDKRLFSRQKEAFAAQLEHADVQFGRIVATLERIGELNNTLIVVTSDNGASGEGGLAGSFNEMRVVNGLQTSVKANMEHIDEWGTAATYNHYHAGWAWAGNTPFQLFKQTVFRGGQTGPLVLHWPDRITATATKGDRVSWRRQYAHITDITPTILEAASISPPEYVDGVRQMGMHGSSLLYSIDDAVAPSQHGLQYYEMYGNLGIYNDGWKAVALHADRMPWDINLRASFSNDTWQLYDTNADFSESNDLAAVHPTKLKELLETMFGELWRYNVFPLYDDLAERIRREYQRSMPSSAAPMVYWPPGAVRITEAISAAQLTKNQSHRIEAVVTMPTEGILVAVGGMTGGFSLFITSNQTLKYVYNYFGMEKTVIVSNATIPSSGEHVLEFVMALDASPQVAGSVDMSADGGLSAYAIMYIDGQPVGEQTIPAVVVGPYSMEETFDVGADFGTSVDNDEYAVPFYITQGTLDKVSIQKI